MKSLINVGRALRHHPEGLLACPFPWQDSFILPALGIPSANPSGAGAFEGLFHTNAPENLVPGLFFFFF